MKKIQFGSGINKLQGWINTDLHSVDVRKKLNYSNNEFDFIFHEHLIEHLDEVDGFNFLKECFRILKPNGVMRVSCPSIDGFIYVYENWKNINPEFKKNFRNKTSFINHITYGESINYIGKMFHPEYKGIKHYSNNSSWHKYLYDKDDFFEKLNFIGFKKIIFLKKHESSIPELKNLERRVGGIFSTFPAEMDLTLEAIK